jgi:3D (Asp-Asp-Asp) domain-containing protein
MKKNFLLIILSLAFNTAMAGERVLQPTIYFTPEIDISKSECTSKYLKTIYNVQGKALMKLCTKDYNTCTMEGQCIIKTNTREILLNYNSTKGGIVRFDMQQEPICKFGYGLRASCLDPYYTVAADQRYWKPGDVIYIPKVRDMMLPNGERHNGYFVVRDKGHAIKGRNRFDFFVGFSQGWRNNLFANLGMSDKDTAIEFKAVTGQEAEAIRQERNFPRIPTED